VSWIEQLVKVSADVVLGCMIQQSTVGTDFACRKWARDYKQGSGRSGKQAEKANAKRAKLKAGAQAVGAATNKTPQRVVF
jgi:hypothetical protein